METKKASLFKRIFSSRITKVFVLALILLSILSAGAYYYFILRKKTANPFDFIPPNSFLILQVNKKDDFVKYYGNNELLKSLDSLSYFKNIKKNIFVFDSILSFDKSLQKSFIEGNIYVTINYLGSDNFQPLIIKPLPHPRYDSQVQKFFQKYFYDATLKENIGKVELWFAKMPKTTQNFYFAIDEGIVLISPSYELIRKSIEISKTDNPFKNNKSFNEVKTTIGKNTVANIFLNNEFLYRFLSAKVSDEKISYLHFISNFANWSSFDLIVDTNKINLTGYTSFKASDNNFLKIFSSEKPQKVELLKYVPVNCSDILWMGFDDYTALRFQQNTFFTEVMKDPEFENNLNDLNKILGDETIENLIFPLISNQIASFSTPQKLSTIKYDNYFLIYSENTEALRQNLISLSKSLSKYSGKSFDSLSYRNYVIYEIPMDYFLFNVFGKMCSSIERTFFTVYQKAVVFANSKEALYEYLNTIIAGRVIEKDKNFQQFSTMLSSECNLFLYCSPQKLIRILPKFFNDTLSTVIEKNIDIFQNFTSFGIQLTNNFDLFLTSVTATYSKSVQDDYLENIEISFETSIASGPFIVPGIDNTRNIILFDAFNQMYFLNEKGEILWRAPLQDKPISRVFAVDMYKNGKIQYLFNTENHLYLFDRLGNIVPPFPIQLAQKPSTPINVFDYENSRDYRIVYCGIDNVIYNLTLSGSAPQGWEFPKLSSNVKEPLKHLRILNNDFIVAKGVNKKLFFLNRKGHKIFEITNVDLSDYSDIFVDNNLFKSFVTTSSDGQVVFIDLQGKVSYKTFYELSQGHVFYFEDFDEDKKNDFVFIDNGKLLLFDENATLKQSIEFSKDAGRKTKFIPESPYGPLILVFTSDGKQCIFVNKTGKILNEFIYETQNNAEIYYNKSKNVLLLATAVDNKLKLYVIE